MKPSTPGRQAIHVNRRKIEFTKLLEVAGRLYGLCNWPK